jgi:hypothetical protein
VARLTRWARRTPLSDRQSTKNLGWGEALDPTIWRMDKAGRERTAWPGCPDSALNIPNFDTGPVYRIRIHDAGVSAMNRMLCLAVAAMSLAFAGFSTGAPAQVAATQIKLTENQIEGFIAAQDELLAVVEKMGAGFSERANPEYDAELDAVTRKHGFKDLAEFDAVATSISMVMTGIDPETKLFTDPQTAIEKEIEDVRSDVSILPGEKKDLLEQLNAAFKAAEPIKFPTNIALVKKHYDKLEVTTIGISDDETASAAMRTISEAK